MTSLARLALQRPFPTRLLPTPLLRSTHYIAMSPPYSPNLRHSIPPSLLPVLSHPQSSSSHHPTTTAAAVAVLGLGLLSGSASSPPALCETAAKPPAPDVEAACHAPLSISPDEHLVAGGVRMMTPLKVHVYILQLYVDTARVPTKMALWRGASPDFILRDKDFWEKLASPVSDLRRTVRMQLVRDVTGKHMQTGFERGLGWRVKYAARKMGLAGGKEGLKEFNKAFVDAGVMKEGSEVLIRFLGHGRIQVCVEGRDAVDIESQPLVWALLQMFYGEKSVAPNVKERVAEGFSELLKTD